MREVLPPLVLLGVLVINLLSSIVDSNRNTKASVLATVILLAITAWGGFFAPLLNFLKA
jgi:hypothetical protein